jgi:hypothetical protein
MKLVFHCFIEFELNTYYINDLLLARCLWWWRTWPRWMNAQRSRGSPALELALGPTIQSQSTAFTIAGSCKIPVINNPHLFRAYVMFPVPYLHSDLKWITYIWTTHNFELPLYPLNGYGRVGKSYMNCRPPYRMEATDQLHAPVAYLRARRPLQTLR